MISLSQMRRRGMRRECGGCTACCYVIAVEQLDKPFRCDCPHAADGCALWSGPGGPGGQPDVCASYRCAWAMGFGSEEDRPDKSGVLVDFRVDDVNNTQAVPALYAIGVNEGDERKQTARDAMTRISRDSGWFVHLADSQMRVLEVF